MSFVCGAALLWGLTASPAGAAPGLNDPGPPWSSFVLQATRLGSTATAEVALEVLSSAAESVRFSDNPMGRPLHASGAEVHKLSVVTTLEILGGRRVRLENHLWFDPRTNTPLYLERTRFGLNDYGQQFRFSAEGVFRQQREPASAAEAEGPPQSWTKLGEHFYPYPANRSGCPPIIETSQLISLASSLLEGPDPALGPLCVFHKRQIHRVSLHLQAARTLSFDYLEKQAGEGIRRAGTVSARGVRVASRPIGSYRGDVEEFFRDGSQLWLSPKGSVPLAVSGELPLIGRVEMRLKEIRMK